TPRVLTSFPTRRSSDLDEDTRVSDAQSLSARARNLYVQVSSSTSFFEPELLTLDEDTLKKYIAEKPELKLYTQYFDNILRNKDQDRKSTRLNSSHVKIS